MLYTMNEESRKAFKEFKEIIKVADKLEKYIIENFKESNYRLEICLVCINKMMIHATSLIKLIPTQEQNIDTSTIHAICRIILELSNNAFFYGTQDISTIEAEFRNLLFEYISKKERKKTLDSLCVGQTDMEEWELTDKELSSNKKKICENKLFTQLIIENKFQGFDSLINPENSKNKYNSRNAIISLRGLNINDFKPIYSIFSIFLHNSPAALSEHILFLRGKWENEDENIEIVMKTNTIPFCLFAMTITETIETHCPKFIETLNDTEKSILKEYSENFRTKK